LIPAWFGVRYTVGYNLFNRLDLDAFHADRKTVDTVERNLEIIGRATANLPDVILDRWPEVPWHYMRGLRNLLIHEYFGVDVGILWMQGDHDWRRHTRRVGVIR
jgi:uncharacterized protein with HEPN domain